MKASVCNSIVGLPTCLAQSARCQPWSKPLAGEKNVSSFSCIVFHLHQSSFINKVDMVHHSSSTSSSAPSSSLIVIVIIIIIISHRSSVIGHRLPFSIHHSSFFIVIFAIIITIVIPIVICMWFSLLFSRLLPPAFFREFQATLSSKIVRDDGFSRPEHVALEQAIMKARPYQRCPS